MKSITLCPEAAEEFAHDARYYERQREGLGADFQQVIETAIARIQKSPQLFPLHGDEGCRKCIVNRFLYTIYYLELEDRISILAVAHQKRRPNYWRGRIAE